MATIARTVLRNVGCRLGWVAEEPDALYPASRLRACALRRLETSPKVRTRFLVRTRYRAGATEGVHREQTTREFYENIAQSHYTLCVRGGGNFSKRFYEVLAMGRVPVLVDTESLLPFENRISWDKYIIRVPMAELKTLPDRVAEHYGQARREGLAKFGRRNRDLWKEWLSFGGFHRHLLEEVLQMRR